MIREFFFRTLNLGPSSNGPHRTFGTKEEGFGDAVVLGCNSEGGVFWLKKKAGDFWRFSQIADMMMLKMMILKRKSQVKMILKMTLKSRFATEDEDDLMNK